MRTPRAVRRTGIYTFFVTLPDQLYPFRCKIRGKTVRGIRSYQHAVRRIEKLYGPGHLGYLLSLYRSLFHVIGSITVIVVVTYVSHTLFGSETALKILFATCIFLVSYQEFYLHRKRYRQLWRKGVLDWLTWVVPIGLYLFMQLG